MGEKQAYEAEAEAESGPPNPHRSLRWWLGCAAMALTYSAAAPPMGLFPLAFLCGVPLLWSLRGRGLVARAGIGFVAGCGISAGTALVPLAGALARYLEISWIVSGPVAAVVVACFGGGGFAVFAVLAGDPARASALGGVPRVAAAWVAGDLFRSVALTGLPWLLLGQLLAPSAPLQALAGLGGLSLLSFWIAALNASLAHALSRRLRWSGLAWGAALAGLGGGAAWLAEPLAAGDPGAVVSARAGSPAPDGALRVALIQPAPSPVWRNDLSRVVALRDRLVELSASAGRVDLLVWPESALPVHLPANRALIDGALAALPEPPLALLLGAPRTGPDGRTTNAAMLVDRDGHFLAHHDKVRRVPFTEYVPAPFEGWLPTNRNVSHVVAGDRPRTLPVGDLAKLGPLVCYEMLFGELAREQVRGGADLLVNLSNDAYFGGDAGARQHLTAAVLRAAELARPVLRATVDGITVAVDARGRVAGELVPGRPGVLVVDVWPRRGSPLSARVGGWVPWLLALGAGLALLRDSARAAGHPDRLE